MNDIWLNYLVNLLNLIKTTDESDCNQLHVIFNNQLFKNKRSVLNSYCDLQVTISKKICEQLNINKTRFTDKDQLIVQFQEYFQKSIFQIESISFTENKLHLKFCRSAIIENVINNILNNQLKYGDFSEDKEITLKYDLVNDTNLSLLGLTELRLKLFVDIAKNLFHKNGYKLTKNCNDVIEISTKNNSKNIDDIKFIKCGPVLNVKTNKKDIETTSDQFYNSRKSYMEMIATHRYGLRNRINVDWESIGKAAVVFELIQVKIRHSVAVNPNYFEFSKGKGIVFVLYNYARMASILKKYSQLLGNIVVPEKINFELLNEEEEWLIIYDYLLKYPYLIRNSIENDLKIHEICTFIEGLCAIFSIYYRRIQILTEPCVHFERLHARISLLKATQIILRNALILLNIQPLDFM